MASSWGYQTPRLEFDHEAGGFELMYQSQHLRPPNECLGGELLLRASRDRDRSRRFQLAEVSRSDETGKPVAGKGGIADGHCQRLFGGCHLCAPPGDIGDRILTDLEETFGYLELVFVFLEDNLRVPRPTQPTPPRQRTFSPHRW